MRFKSVLVKIQGEVWTALSNRSQQESCADRLVHVFSPSQSWNALVARLISSINLTCIQLCISFN